MASYNCLSPACHLISKIKIHLLNKMHDLSEKIVIFLKGLYLFSCFILIGTLLCNLIPMLITLFYKEIYITQQSVNPFFPSYYNHVLVHSAPLRIYTSL